MFWAIIEMLRNEATYKLPLDKTTLRAIKMHTATTIDVEQYLKDCISEYTDGESGNGLFNSDNKFFWSASLLRRMEKYEILKEKNIGVIIDDRENITIGAKMKDCKVLGTPYLVVIGDKQEGEKVELENMKTGEKEIITIEQLLEKLK